jgi:hypothetical protein
MSKPIEILGVGDGYIVLRGKTLGADTRMLMVSDEWVRKNAPAVGEYVLEEGGALRAAL